MGPENGRRPNNPVTSLPKVVPIPKLVEPIRGPRLWYNSKPDVAAIHGTPSTIRHQNSSQTKKYPTKLFVFSFLFATPVIAFGFFEQSNVSLRQHTGLVGYNDFLI
ncbi:hypothetical protein AFLA_010558 [Aspergillus flavus NRRL3357]|nr:hypothetical protein AFLA_010558 [Aspergillus flavus NRRL3357]